MHHFYKQIFILFASICFSNFYFSLIFCFKKYSSLYLKTKWFELIFIIYICLKKKYNNTNNKLLQINLIMLILYAKGRIDYFKHVDEVVRMKLCFIVKLHNFVYLKRIRMCLTRLKEPHLINFNLILRVEQYHII